MQVPIYLWNSWLGSLAVLLIDLCDIMAWRCTSSKFTVLKFFILKIQNKATLMLKLDKYPFQSPFDAYIQVQTYSYLPHSIQMLMPLKYVLVDSFLWVIHVHDHHLKSSICGCIKALHSLEMKRKEHMNGIHSGSVKKWRWERGKMRMLDSIPPRTCISIHTCTWSEWWTP